MSPLASLISRLRHLRSSESGAAAVTIALAAPVVIGGMALGAETGYWHFTQRKLQHAADVAAHAAVIRKRANDNQDNLKVAALRVATGSGFLPASGSLSLHNPPQTGPNTTQENAVEVILLETHPRLLSSIFSDEPVQIRARAVANLTGGSPACVLGLANTDPAMTGAVTVTGSANVKLTNCTASTNSAGASSFYLEGSGKLAADCATTVGGADTGSGLTLTCQDNGGDVITGAPPILDPYKNAPWPTPTGTCTRSVVSGVTTISADGREVYCDLSNLKDTISIKPGRYVVPTGKVFSALAGAKISGTGVTFFFEGTARLDIAGHADLSLAAPTDPSDPYSGILFYGNATASAQGVTHQMLGSSGSVLTGAIYMPQSNVVYQGNSTISGSCLQIIANKVTFTGNTEIDLGASCAGAGTKPLLTGQIVKIVE